MIERRNGNERGHAQHGWLESWHSFSFASYYDPEHSRFGDLRVINDDIIAGGGGFAPHPHRDMEIITYVLSGALAHKDSMGNGSTIKRGDIQRMSAGTGVVHSEFNASPTEPVTLLQIWITPNQNGLAPGYQQTHISDELKRGRLVEIASEKGSELGVRLNQDVNIFAGLFDGTEVTHHDLNSERRYYLHVARGAIIANGEALQHGDAIKLTKESSLVLQQGQNAEVLLFDLS